MKYPKEMYLDSGYYAMDDDDELTNHTEKIVKCRKPHMCAGGCDRVIRQGDYALCERGFLDNKPVSCYTCLPCIELWLEESGQVEVPND